MTRLSRIVVLASLLCSGCAIGPKYQRPVATTPVALKEMAGNDRWKMATPGDGLLKGKWWEIFGDPQLNRLEELVNVNNQNVKQAEAQFRQARALVAANHANYYPTIGSTPAITQSDAGRNTGRGNGTNQSFSLPATATWEPDLWGRVRLSVENAVSNAQVSAADLENIKLSQQALLATDYFLLAAQDMQIKVLSDTIDSLREKPATHDQSLQRRSSVEVRYYPGANPACRREGPEYGYAYRARAGRARHSHPDRTDASLPRNWPHHDQRSSSAYSGGCSLGASRAPSRYRRE